MHKSNIGKEQVSEMGNRGKYAITPGMQNHIDALMNLLPTGAENAVKTVQVAALLAVDRRDLYRIMEVARVHGYPVCSSKSGRESGLFIPATVEEWQGYINRVEREIDSRTAVRNGQIKALYENKG